MINELWPGSPPLAVPGAVQGSAGCRGGESPRMPDPQRNPRRRRALRELFWALPASAFRAITCPGSRDPRSCHSAAAARASSSLRRPQRLLLAGSPPPPPPPRAPDREGPRLGCVSRPDRCVLPPPLGASGGPVVRGVRLLSGRSGCGPGPASLRFPRVPGALALSSAQAPLGPPPAPGSQVSFLPGPSGVCGTADPPPQGRARESVDLREVLPPSRGRGRGRRGVRVVQGLGDRPSASTVARRGRARRGWAYWIPRSQLGPGGACLYLGPAGPQGLCLFRQQILRCRDSLQIDLRSLGPWRRIWVLVLACFWS